MCYGQNARRGSLSPRCDLTHRVAAGGGAKSRQAQPQILRLFLYFSPLECFEMAFGLPISHIFTKKKVAYFQHSG
jgi:hypothetical protein